ncbi:glycosyltransferase family 4 protein [Candidatus Parcubacteria bacterium]|nr:glycosyltransferase family 4 protein [Candidatus Parcubacteria bacterium]
MRIIYLFNGRLPTEKAHGVQVMRACEGFAKTGAEVTLILPYRRNVLNEDPFDYYQVSHIFDIKKVRGLDFWTPSRLLFHLQNAVSIFWMLKEVWPLKNNSETIFYARDYATLWALSLFGFKPVAEIHDYRLPNPRKYANYVFNQAKMVVANSEGTKEGLLEHYSISPSKIAVASNGVDLDFFNIAETKSEARAKLNIKTTNPIVAYVGRPESAGTQKGLGTFLEAVSTLPGVASYVVGGAKESIQQYQEKYQNVIFTSQVPYKEIPLYLRAIDVVVIPLPLNKHATTTSPIKLFEFMAAGKAIIASNLPSLRTFLNDQNAVFFEPGDAQGLSVMMSRVLGDKGLSESISAQARQSVSNHTWENRAKIIIDYLKWHTSKI